MTRYLTSAILLGILAMPAAARAQHSRGADTPSVGTATSSAPAPAPAPSSSSSGGSSTPSQSSGGSTAGESGRSRGNLPGNGAATRRGAGGVGGGGTIIIEGSGFYPWGWADDGAIGGYGGYYGGYYGAYDPWYGWFPTYAPSAYGSDSTGALRLKVKPAEASVYADGFYVGIVDDFDGVFQKLRLDSGPHRIEIRGREYQPLSVDVMIQDDLTIMYRGELAKQ